jgi:hypothetical protein
LPDLLVTINFTTLGINAPFPSNYILRTVSIVVGLHRDVLDVIHNTLPIPLVPDAHLVGGVIQTIREQFKRPGLASLGVFSSVCPSAHVSTLVLIKPRGDARKRRTLQVLFHSYCQTLPCRFLETITLPRYACTYRTITLTGASLSSIGRNPSWVEYPQWEASGQWSTGYLPPYLGRLCCGSSLVGDVLFHIAVLTKTSGVKPLSTFGLIHRIPPFKPVLDDDPDGRYRNLLSASQSDGGLLDYVRDRHR